MKKISNVQKQILFRIGILAVISVLLGILGYISSRKTDYYVDSYDISVYEMEDDWTYVYGDGTTGEISLPHYFNSRAGETVSLSAVLQDDYSEVEVPYVLISVKYQNVAVYLDEEKIYEYQVPENGISKTSGGLYLFVKLPENWKNRTLTLEYEQLLGSSAKYKVSAPILGDKMDIYRWQLRKEALGLVLDFAIALVGIFLIFVDVVSVFKKRFYTPFLLIGIFAVTCSVYFAIQSVCVNIAISNFYMSYALEFIALLMAVVEITVLLFSYMKGATRKIGGALVISSALYAAAVIFCNMVLKIDFKVTLPITDAYILVGAFIIVMLFVVVKDGFTDKKMVVSSILPFCIGAILDVLLYYMGIGQRPCLKLGFLIFAIMQIRYNYRKITELHSEHIKAETYRVMAYQDALTGIGNRAAYIRDIEILQRDLYQQKDDRRAPGCMSVDANRLKETNDKYGHAQGDLLIIEVAEILEKAVGAKGSVYRVGGDEFIIIYKETDEYELRHQRRELEVQRDRFNQGRDIPVSFSIGMALYKKEDITLERTITRADAAMYREKEIYHHTTG